MKIARVPAAALAVVFAMGGSAAGQQAGPATENLFTLGTAQFIQEKDSPNTFSIVVPVEVRKPGHFEKPGLKLAYVLFDQPVKTPPGDLKSVENSYVVNFDKNKQPQAAWKVRSERQNIDGDALFYMGAPQYKAIGTSGVVRIGLHDLPNKDIGLFVFDTVDQPGSNVLIFRKADFTVGDGEATFQAAVAKIPAGGQPGTSVAAAPGSAPSSPPGLSSPPGASSSPGAGQTPGKIFGLGTPQCIQEQGGSFTIVVPVQVQKLEHFEKPGLKLAYVLFDQPVTTPPGDLKSVENSLVVNTDTAGKQDKVWQVRSAQQSVFGHARLFKNAPQYKAVGNRGVLRFGLRSLPNNDIGLFISDELEPGSNVLVIRKADFTVGDGDAAFQAAAAKLPAGN
jgi:hypothetical protein